MAVSDILPLSIVRVGSFRRPVNYVELVYEACAKKTVMKRVESVCVDRAIATKISLTFSKAENADSRCTVLHATAIR